MTVTIDGITYDGTVDEIRRIVENPPRRPAVEITTWPPSNEELIEKTTVDFNQDWEYSRHPQTGTPIQRSWRDDITSYIANSRADGNQWIAICENPSVSSMPL